MEAPLVTALLWVCAIGCGALAGVYLAFSAFVMRALGTMAPTAGVAAMNAINACILRSAFLPLFLATTLAAAGLAGWSLWRWETTAAPAIAAGGVIHGLGMFVVTIACNVPLNDALAASGPATLEGEALWRRYRRVWTRWNHLRTLACIVASALFILALVSRG